MAIEKPIVLAASPRAVVAMLDHEDRGTVIDRIAQFCDNIQDPKIAASWRQDLLTVVYEKNAPRNDWE